jgi:hypothetical protein
MKKLLLFVAVFATLGLNAQTIIFSDGFESYDVFSIANVGNWTLIDVDQSNTYGFQGVTFPNSGSPMAFIVFDNAQTSPPVSADFGARTGNKAMASFAATTPVNNDWLITPQVQLGVSGNVVSFWAKSATVTWGEERFRVGISTTGSQPADFTIITPGTHVSVGAEWTQFTYELDATYANQNVRIAINCVSDDAFVFLVDDFTITTAGLANVTANEALNAVAYPNPASDVLNISVAGDEVVAIAVIAMDGKIVSNNQGSTALVADLTAGMYIYEATTASGAVIRNTFVKK